MQQTVSAWSSILFYLVIFIAFYYIFFSSQKKREKQFKEMIASLKEGDNITTMGGIIGKVTHISEDEVSIETGLERTKIKIAKWAVRNIEKSTETK